MFKRSMIVVAVGVLLGALGPLPAGAEHADPFQGTWRAVDVDGSNLWLTVSEDETPDLTVLDDNVTGGLCEWGGEPRGAGIVEGTGEVSGDGSTLHGIFTFLRCLADDAEHVLDPPVEGDFVHDAGTDTLTDTSGVVWHRLRPRGPSDPFLGTWRSTDLDGSSQSLSFAGNGDVRRFRFVDHNATLACADGGRFLARGTGNVVDDGGRLEATFETVRCVDRTDTSHLVGVGPSFEHDPETDTLLDDSGVVWRR